MHGDAYQYKKHLKLTIKAYAERNVGKKKGEK